jgi:hypothetical protein
LAHLDCWVKDIRHQTAICEWQTVEEFMQGTVRAVLLLAGLAGIGIAGASAGLAAPGGNRVDDGGALATLVQPAQYWRGDRCERLRRACVYKDERGERGEGNCRYYRQECGGTSYCERLRRACVYKEYRGEVGEGNCRRYRNECGGY